MDTFVSMLRGINVGAKNRIKMKDLARLYESLGFRSVSTYLQSGNVVFDSSRKSVEELKEMIEAKTKEELSFPVSVLLRTPSELQDVIDNNPFSKEKGIDTDRVYITFMSSAPAESALSQRVEIDDEADRFVAMNREIYLYCPNGYGRTRFSNEFFEKKLLVTATTRNLRTVNMLLAIAKKHSC